MRESRNMSKARGQLLNKDAFCCGKVEAQLKTSAVTDLPLLITQPKPLCERHHWRWLCVYCCLQADNHLHQLVYNAVQQYMYC
jgi:hypothetical protein